MWAYNFLRTKHFHGVSSAGPHIYLLKSRYGKVSNFRVLVPVLVFLLVGVAVLYFTGEGRRLHMPYGVSYSIDMLLPVIKLNKAHDEVIRRLIPSVRWYFYCHQIVGYILASFLVAGLAGLTKKN